MNDNFKCFIVEDHLLLTDSDVGIVEKSVAALGFDVHDKWFPIQSPPSQHITGDIHLKISKKGTALNIKVLECNYLAAQDPNGYSDPYVTLLYGKMKKKTQIIKKNLNPFFGETFLFRWDDDVHHLEVSVWDWDRIGGNDFLGQILIPAADMMNDGTFDRKYLLLPSQESKASTPRERKDLGEIRLRLSYSEQRVYPITTYLGLLGLLMVDKIPFVKSLIHVLPDKAASADCLVKIFDSNCDSLRLVKNLTSVEIAETVDPSIIFRGNSLITKSMDSFMRNAGASYLRLVLGPLVTEVANLRESYEVDPLKATNGEDIQKNMNQLILLCGNFVNRIFESAERCPVIMRDAFTHIRDEVNKKYSKEQILVVKYTSVSAFVFLRFFCPAIQNPKKHGLLDRMYPETSRTFTLVAKTIQNLANLVKFGEKEPFMKPMNTFIVDNLENMKVYLNILSVSEIGLRQAFLPPEQQLSSIPKTKIGISEDLWVEKELATMHSYLLASYDKIVKNLEGDLKREFQSVLNQLKNCMDEQDAFEAENTQ